MLAVQQKETSLNLNYATGDMQEEFVGAVLASYEVYARHNDYPVVHDSFTGVDDGEYYEAFYETYMVVLDCIAINGFGVKAEFLNTEQSEEMDEEITNNWWNVEDNLMEDISDVLKAHQLFFVPIRTVYYGQVEQTSYILHDEIKNSPLQEVW